MVQMGMAQSLLDNLGADRTLTGWRDLVCRGDEMLERLNTV